MPLAHGRPGGKFTLADYETWPDDERWEIIGGKAYAMTPAPTVAHQTLVVRLVATLHPMLAGRPCQAFVAPTDVVLSDTDIVQPDVFIVCDPSRVTAANIRGAPDVVFELLSPATALKDRKIKRDLYARHGVPEYLLVDPEGQYMEQLCLRGDGTYGESNILGPADTLRLKNLPEVVLPLSELFGVGRVEESGRERSSVKP